MYCGLILLSVWIFGSCFALDDLYQRLRRISLEYALTSALAGLVILILCNGFRLECTAFTLAMALLNVLVNLGYTLCSFRALEYINLLLYSVFSMLGGMALPFLQGVLIYGEPLTAGKIICVMLICAALTLTVRRGRPGRQVGWYAGVFLLNGGSGMLCKFYAAHGESRGLLNPDLPVYGVYRRAAAAPSALSGGAGHDAKERCRRGAERRRKPLRQLPADDRPVPCGRLRPVPDGHRRRDDRFQPSVPYLAEEASRRESLSVLIGFAGMLALFLIPD